MVGNDGLNQVNDLIIRQRSTVGHIAEQSIKVIPRHELIEGKRLPNVSSIPWYCVTSIRARTASRSLVSGRRCAMAPRKASRR